MVTLSPKRFRACEYNYFYNKWKEVPKSTCPANYNAPISSDKSKKGTTKFQKNSVSVMPKKFRCFLILTYFIDELRDLYSPPPHPPPPGREKIGKKCKISGEKLVFSPQISYIIVRWNAVNAVKLCKFTARISGDLTKNHHNSPLKHVVTRVRTSHPPHPLLPPLRHLSIRSSIFVLNINQIHSTFFKTCAVNFCKICYS